MEVDAIDSALAHGNGIYGGSEEGRLQNRPVRPKYQDWQANIHGHLASSNLTLSEYCWWIEE